ncbi:flagellar assembly protein T N-terminal domain-containing protein [Paraglaciecola aestuariivivens]
MKQRNLFKCFLVLTMFCYSQLSLAVWFEATGQAVVQRGEKDAARQLATQEAIKQALLFAGASVSSVQSLANGLLQDDRFEIRSAGEVNAIELIDEMYHDDVITVSIRADIFPQEAQCMASDYKKFITTTYYPLYNRQHAAAGNLYDFGKVLAEKIQSESQQYANYAHIHRIEPFYLQTLDSERHGIVVELAKQSNAQYVLFGEIENFAVEPLPPSALAFWQDPQMQRNLTLSLALYNGQTGEQVFKDKQSITAPWDFDLHTDLDSSSRQLWTSTFGQATQEMIQTLVQSIDESVSCLPAYGRVLTVNNDELTINIGSQSGVKVNDQLILFQLNQFFDDKNQSHRQFHLHPEKVVVKRVYTDSAVVSSVSGLPLANIQPNDFVARR